MAAARVKKKQHFQLFVRRVAHDWPCFGAPALSTALRGARIRMNDNIIKQPQQQ